jgi:parallel beta-helix repeat protein
MSLVNARSVLSIAAAALLAAPAVHAVDGVIEINDTSIIAAGGYPFAITTPGSYVLTGNLAPPGSGALVVTVADVVIDLNGFAINGAGAAGAGITAGAGTTVRNGSITGFGGAGIIGAGDLKLFETRITGNGAGVVGPINCLIVKNVISSNAGVGVDARNCKIENNVISDNGDSGIMGATNLIVHNVINMNGFGLGGGGVLSFMGSTIQENEITGNLGFGVSDTPGAPPGPVPAPPGIPFPPAPPPGIARQMVMKNVIDGSPGGIGVFFSPTGGVVTDNTVTNNAFDGIVCATGCTVRGNTVDTNNFAAAGNGGMTIGPGSAVNDNSVSFNTGIGAVLSPLAGYTNNTLNANTIQDMSLFVPAAPIPPHPTSGFMNLCSGVPGPAVGLCP